MENNPTWLTKGALERLAEAARKTRVSMQQFQHALSLGFNVGNINVKAFKPFDYRIYENIKNVRVDYGNALNGGNLSRCLICEERSPWWAHVEEGEYWYCGCTLHLEIILLCILMGFDHDSDLS